MEIGVILAIISTVSILFTYLLYRFFKEKKLIKYLPSIIMTPVMIYYFISMHSAPSEGFQDLARFIMGLFLLTAITASLITSVILDVLDRKKQN